MITSNPQPDSEATPPYAELEVMSNFTFLQGASHPDELVYRAAELGQSAIAITDLNSLAGVVRAHDAAKKSNIKLIVGTRLRLVDAPDILAWAPNRIAYGRLCRLLTLGRRRAAKGQCILSLDDILEQGDCLLAAVAMPDPAKADATSVLRRLKDSFASRLSLIVRCNYDGADQSRLQRLFALARSHGVPAVATNHVHYHDASRRPLQDVLTCIRHRCAISEAGYRLLPNAEHCLKSPRQMHRLFHEYPQAIARGLDIAGQCQFSLDELKYEYPDELSPAGQTPLQYLAELAWAGAAVRYPQGIPDKVRGQINHELTLIESLQFEAYFLTVYDLVRFARSRGILCQGRGSAANSAVCYCIGITSVDPDRIDVLFERFISRARGEPPDIDVDFEHERREEVIQYIYQKYGRERAGMTAALITYRGRSAVRDVGKALGLGMDIVDQIARRLDMWHSGKVSDEALQAAGLDATNRTVRLLVDRTTEIMGFPRHLSQHTGGMVMTRGPLCELVPIENASMEDRTVIEWDKNDIDTLGILKVDVLALGMLTCISKCLTLLNDRRSPGERPMELYTIPAEEPSVYEMISDADTVGVFQIESRAQMSMLPRLRPQRFYDLVIEVAIVRPGPIQGDMVHPYLRRRNGLEPVTFPSEALRSVLGKTLGVPLFQEQAMKAVMVAADFTAEDADRLRRAMAAWRHNGQIEQFHEKVVRGMARNGYTMDFAERLFEQIKGFGSYGFPESHAASFALLVYASAWIKRHHPAIFACGLLNSLPMGFYAPAQIVRDAREHGVEVRAVDVNFSTWDSSLEACDDLREATGDKRTWAFGGPALRLGLRRIKGLRDDDARRIVAARRRGAFESIDQFHEATQLSADVIERLADADAFGSIPQNRRTALWHTLAIKDETLPLFDDPAKSGDDGAVALPSMPIGQEVMADYATLGLSIKQHPVALVRSTLASRGVIPASELAHRQSGWVKVAGLVLIRQRPSTASGIVFITLEDETGIANLILRPDLYKQYRQAARHAYLLQADGYLERQGQVIHILAKRLHDLSALLSGYAFRSRDFH